jgi:hypothetical protein
MEKTVLKAFCIDEAAACRLQNEKSAPARPKTRSRRGEVRKRDERRCVSGRYVQRGRIPLINARTGEPIMKLYSWKPFVLF